jgi:hypothetical protein
MLIVNFYEYVGQTPLARITALNDACHVPSAGESVTIAIDENVPAIEGRVQRVESRYGAQGCTVSVHLSDLRNV